MPHTLILSIATAFLLFPSLASAGLKIYYVRHGETLGNVKAAGEITDEKGKALDTQTFTEAGQEEVARLTASLQKLPLEFIASSPTDRAKNTIRPYLLATGRKAEIWPELAEITTVGTNLDGVETPPVSAELFTGGRTLHLKGDDLTVFTVREDGGKFVKIPEDPTQAEVDKNAVAEKLTQLILDRYAGKDTAILLLGHGGNARRFFSQILAYKSDPVTAQKIANSIGSVNNAKINLLEEQPDGSFKLVMLNNEPVP